MGIYIGVDGGGTKTQVFAFDSVTKKSALARGEASNVNSVGWDTAVERIVALSTEASRQLGSSNDLVEGLCAGLAGMDRAHEIARMKAELGKHFSNANIVAVNDALPALSAGTRGASGIVLIAGTGSICVGEDDLGRVARSGGFGYLIGDEGSGFDIGRRGLMAAIQAFEGRGPETALWSRVQSAFEIEEPGSLIAKVYQSHHPVGTVASFAREVLSAAGALTEALESPPDDVARQIVLDAVADHARLVEATARQLGPQVAVNLVLAGGLYTNSLQLQAWLQEKLPAWNLTLPSVSAAAGAALRAVKAATAQAEEGRDHPRQPSAPLELLLQVWSEVAV